MKAKTLISPVCNGGPKIRFISETAMSRNVNTRHFHRQGEAMDTDALIFLSVVVALGIGGVIVYLKGR